MPVITNLEFPVRYCLTWHGGDRYNHYELHLHSFVSFVGELVANSTILREISSLCNQLPVLDNQLFEKSFQEVSECFPLSLWILF